MFADDVQHEYGVRTRRLCVHVRRFDHASCGSTSNQSRRRLNRVNDLALDAAHLRHAILVNDGVFVAVRTSWLEQIAHLFVINFDVRSVHGVGPTLVRILLRRLDNFSDRARDYTPHVTVTVTEHGMRLTRAGLPVGE